ncbi:2-succinyl-5-enolpyruvyl-6-hydroxy-3-cyclohexene-1-carboxylate synthase [Cognatitamlana onchidii]|uniref:2-succinyl-5-enolpyruvyl-6-hydroxy-3- cyclohexene-1-carboxylate synthase n=1 Tax=Cognatitamlana onchidii TaxID=2562860 RepID=UPI0010A62FDA|nr:thiamine pyrophosphate-binding protein [Algibacter onchidii]
MIYPKIPLAQTVIQLCKLQGVKHIIISPGSRNAPLTIGFTNDSYFKCYSIVDERCAGFFALGIAQQLREPTALVCTSGSALLNYYPAVSEAYYSDIPLIVLSADRPKYLVGIGDGQTINQKNVFENHVVLSVNLKLDLKTDGQMTYANEPPIIKNIQNKLEHTLGLKEDIQAYNEQSINKAISAAIVENGPVHINVPFDEPLYEIVQSLNVSPRAIDFKKNHQNVGTELIRACVDTWNTSLKKMILVGVNYPNEIDPDWLVKLAEDDSVIVLTETTSNLHHHSFFSNIDQLIAPLTEKNQKELQPDVLLTFGGLVVSKKIKQLLRKFKPKHHWHVDPKKANDTFFSLNKHIETTPNSFFKAFLPKVSKTTKSSYKPYWSGINDYRANRHKAYLTKIPFSDFKVFKHVLDAIPDNSILQSGNSSTIRYTQLFNLKSNIEVYCNRGTSGIDGSTSTAIGCAVARNEPTIFITGDLSFLYDSNALWNNHIPTSFRIIVINNQGGGIFRILPGHKNTENFDTYFETNHQLTAEHLCKMYNLEYQSAFNEGELKMALTSFYLNGGRPKVLEVFTPKSINDTILLDYFEYLK